MPNEVFFQSNKTSIMLEGLLRQCESFDQFEQICSDDMLNSDCRTSICSFCGIIQTDKTTKEITDMKNEHISIISQAFYGNRTGTEIRRENIDRFILGYQTDDFDVTEAIDRTVIHLPGSDNLVLVYNKHQEEERLKVKERALREDNYVIKPLASIPELDLEIYSRCIVCRMNAVGGFESLGEEDSEIWSRYLAY